MPGELYWLHFVALFLHHCAVKLLASYAKKRYIIASSSDYTTFSVSPR